MLEQAYQTMYTVVLVLLGIGLVFALLRAVLGPRIADRIMGINMAGTMTIAAIAVLSFMLKEGYLLDVCLIYVMISFLAVVVLSKIYITVHMDKQEKAQNANPMVSYAPTEDGEDPQTAAAIEEGTASPAAQSVQKGGC